MSRSPSSHSNTSSEDCDFESLDPPLSPGTFVVFSLATDLLTEANDDPHIKEALSRFKARKYLGLVWWASKYKVNGEETGDVELSHVAVCPPRDDYARWVGIPKYSYLDHKYYLRLDPSSSFEGPVRPLLTSAPVLPYRDAVVYTIFRDMLSVGRVHRSDRSFSISQEELEKLRETASGDIDEHAQLRDSLSEEELGRPVARPRKPSITVADEEAKFGPRPFCAHIIDIWEDLPAELPSVPYPGDFTTECYQIRELVDRAWRRLPYEDVLNWPKQNVDDKAAAPLENPVKASSRLTDVHTSVESTTRSQEPPPKKKSAVLMQYPPRRRQNKHSLESPGRERVQTELERVSLLGVRSTTLRARKVFKLKMKWVLKPCSITVPSDNGKRWWKAQLKSGMQPSLQLMRRSPASPWARWRIVGLHRGSKTRLALLRHMIPAAQRPRPAL